MPHWFILAAQLQTFSDGEVPLVVQELQPQILDVSAQADAARQILSQPLTLDDRQMQRMTLVLLSTTLKSLRIWLSRNACKMEIRQRVQVLLNPRGLNDLLVPVKEQVDRLPSDAKFIFNDETLPVGSDGRFQSGPRRWISTPASKPSMKHCARRTYVPLVINEAQPRLLPRPQRRNLELPN